MTPTLMEWTASHLIQKMGLGLYSRGLKIKIQKFLGSVGIVLQMRLSIADSYAGGCWLWAALIWLECVLHRQVAGIHFFNILSTFLEIFHLVLTIVLKSKFYSNKKKKTSRDDSSRKKSITKGERKHVLILEEATLGLYRCVLQWMLC